MVIGTVAGGSARGLPDASSVVRTTALRPQRTLGVSAASLRSAGGYTILRTTQTDEYEADLVEAAVAEFGTAEGTPSGDDFRGTARRAAKTSIAEADTEDFDDLAKLIATLPDHESMEELDIPTTASSARVDEEQRNVRVTAFLYAASRENDNDYHLIIGRDRQSVPPLYMTVEVSGLPPTTSTAYARLANTRRDYKAFFGSDLPGTSYDFYDPPIPVEIEGSLFWDASHAHGSRPGPASLRDDMPVVWEVHPVSRIRFEP